MGNGLWGSAIFNAKGNAYGPSSLASLSNSIVRSRTPFTFAAKGLGIAGEKGGSPGEAILPLLRDARGRLGVSGAGGAPSVNIEIVNATGEAIAKESVTTRRSKDGGIDVRAVIRNVVAEGLATPGDPIRRSFETVYGNRPKLTRR